MGLALIVCVLVYLLLVEEKNMKNIPAASILTAFFKNREEPKNCCLVLSEPEPFYVVSLLSSAPAARR